MVLAHHVLGNPVEVVVHLETVLRGGILHAPVVEEARGTVRRADEEVVADDEVRRGRRVVVHHQVRAVRIRAMRVAPAVSRIDAGVVLEENVAREAPRIVVPVLKGILGLPDHVVAPDHIRLPTGIVLRLVRERRVVDLPETVAFDEVVVALAPELNAVAKADRVPGQAGLFVLFPELESAANPVDVAVADHDVPRAAAAEAMRRAVAHAESIVDDVVAPPFAHDVARQRELDGGERLSGIARIAHLHALLLGDVAEFEVVHQVRGVRPGLRPVGLVPLLAPPPLPVVADEDAHVGGNGRFELLLHAPQAQGNEVEDRALRHHVADGEMEVGGRQLAHAPHRNLDDTPFGTDFDEGRLPRQRPRPGEDVEGKPHPVAEGEGLRRTHLEAEHRQIREILHLRPPELQEVRSRTDLLLQRHADEALAVLLHGPRAAAVAFLVGGPPRPADGGAVPELLLHDRRRALLRRPEVLADQLPVLGTTAVHALLEDGLLADAIRTIGHGIAGRTALGIERAAPEPAPAKEHRVARLDGELVRPLERTDRGRLTRSDGGVVAVHAVHKPSLRDGSGRHGDAEKDCHSFHAAIISHLSP